MDPHGPRHIQVKGPHKIQIDVQGTQHMHVMIVVVVFALVVEAVCSLCFAVVVGVV